MATLPDFDTSQASLACYYNIIDNNAVSSVDAGESLSYGNVDSYTTYDNGWVGTITTNYAIDINCRFKNDGWVLLWVKDNPEQYGEVSTHFESKNAWGSLAGRSTMLFDPYDTPTPTNTAAGQIISDLINELSNSGNIAYSQGDETWYDFQLTDATKLGIYHDEDQGSADVSFTDGMTIYHLEISGHSNLSNSGDLEFSGTKLTSGQDNAVVIDEFSEIDTSLTHSYTGDYIVFTCLFD